MKLCYWYAGQLENMFYIFILYIQVNILFSEFRWQYQSVQALKSLGIEELATTGDYLSNQRINGVKNAQKVLHAFITSWNI